MTPPSAPPPLRRDAAANRERILQAAGRAFADRGADMSMIALARLAGVGSATLYRNFPSRRALLEALYSHEVDALCAAASDSATDATAESPVGSTARSPVGRTAESTAGATPGSRFVAWLSRFGDYYVQKGVVAAELLEHTDEQDPVFTSGYERIVAAGSPLLAAARRSGEARADLTIDQVLALVAAVARIPGDAAFREPLVRAALDALCPSPSPDPDSRNADSGDAPGGPR